MNRLSRSTHFLIPAPPIGPFWPAERISLTLHFLLDRLGLGVQSNTPSNRAGTSPRREGGAGGEGGGFETISNPNCCRDIDPPLSLSAFSSAASFFCTCVVSNHRSPPRACQRVPARPFQAQGKTDRKA
jgi:hypothetical protein